MAPVPGAEVASSMAQKIGIVQWKSKAFQEAKLSLAPVSRMTLELGVEVTHGFGSYFPESH